MADFGSSATDIQAPQDAGSSPVVTQRTPTMPNNNAASFAQLGATLASGVKDYIADQQAKAQQAVIGDYARKQAGINSALDQGNINPQEAHVRSNALANESLAAYPALAEQIGKVRSTFAATTSLGDTDKNFDSAIKIRQANTEKENANAIAQGWHLPDDPNDPARDVIIKATTEQTRVAYDLEQASKKQAFDQSRGTYNQAQGDRQIKQDSEQLVQRIYTSQSDGLFAQMKVLREKAKAGTLSWDEANAQMGKLLNDTNGVIQSASIRNPELATPYRSLIDGIGATAKNYLDPAKDSESVEKEYKDQITRSKLAAISDPSVRSAAVASAMFGANNPILSSYNASAVVNTITKLSTTPVTNGKASQYTPNIVGAPEEGDLYKALRAGVNDTVSGKNTNQPQAWQEGSNTTNNVLAQVGREVDAGNPKILKPAADFFASSEFLTLQQKGSLDPASLAAAKKTFQVVYEPAVRSSLAPQLSMQVPVGDKSVATSDLLDVKMVNGQPAFVPKGGLDADSTKAANDKIKGLTQYQQGLNQVVRIGAHMEGTADYQKYWEDNKYVLLPQLYPVKPGQVVDGYKWSGSGDYKDKNTWTKVGNG